MKYKAIDRSNIDFTSDAEICNIGYFEKKYQDIPVRGEKFFANHNLVILDVNKVEFEDNVVIGAGSVVNEDIPLNVVPVGNSCRVVKELK